MNSPPPPLLLLTCEHAGNLIPAQLAPFFRNRARLLNSHRGWDPGALELATHLATTLRAPLLAALVSRLVVDLNRSRNNPTLFSTITATLDDEEKARILETYYDPYRNHIEREAKRVARARRFLLHISVHTFTPILRGQTRDVDIGLLFDPTRKRESAVARTLKQALAARLATLTIRFNQPYRGADDGLTTHLRALVPDARYAGIEIEVNQRFARRPTKAWGDIKHALTDSLADVLRDHAAGAKRR